jgi:hypothetical protein
VSSSNVKRLKICPYELGIKKSLKIKKLELTVCPVLKVKKNGDL